jgi:hypothetical protein
MSQAKTCRGCQIVKPLAEFHLHSQMGDGHLNFCMVCVRQRVAEHRRRNLEKVREYDRQRAHLPHRKTRKVTAYNVVEAAIHAGTLTPKPCERCGFALGVQAHHEDYSKPLDVNWLCTKCHGERHREINAERRRKAA